VTSLARRRFILVVAALAAMVLLGGCNVFRNARRVQAEPPPPFQSPITTMVGHPGMSIPQIAEAIQPRQADTRAILASLSVTVGQARSRTRMQFDASMYFAPPDFLRVRGSADTGTLFDFLVHENHAQVMVVPEKKFYSGTQAALRNNPDLMAGIQPDDLMQSFLVEQNLYRHLTNPASNASLRETKDHYLLTVSYATGVTEAYSLRMNDLLVDRIERSFGRRAMGSVRFDGYAFYTPEHSKTPHLLPTRFEAQLPSGAVATVVAEEIQPNAKRQPALETIDVPPDYQRLPL